MATKQAGRKKIHVCELLFIRKNTLEILRDLFRYVPHFCHRGDMVEEIQSRLFNKLFVLQYFAIYLLGMAKGSNNIAIYWV